nr:MAG TPA: portal protein [Bacteriophage sp.]
MKNYGWNINRDQDGHVTVDQQQSGRDLDILILRTLIVDGEVFVKKIIDSKSKFGVRYEVLDTLDIDFMYNVHDTGNGEKIVMGIKLDKTNKPLSYFVRTSNTDYYQTGERIEVSASEIIHIYRKFFPGQVRGFTPLSATILNINQLDGYKEAEIVAARLNACNQAFYVKDGSNTDILDDADDTGTIATEYSPGTIRFAPEGYTLQQLQNNHPSGNFGTFCKNVMRSIANSLGTSYNKTTSDYESVNYSSLREAALEDRSSWEEFQTFLIDNWKDLQYQEFLKYVLLNELTALPFSRYEKFLKHKFYGRTWDWVDPLKDLNAIKVKLELRLSDPITETEKLGYDVDEVLNRWQLWENKLKERNLSITTEEYVQFLDDPDNDNDQEENNDEKPI